MAELQFSMLLSLREMALRKFVALLWSGSDILVSISKFRYHERKMKKKVLKLGLPKLLTEQMCEIVRPIGLQIKRWKKLQKSNLSDEAEEIILPDSSILCWTSAGVLDYRKTAIEFVRCDVIDVVLRYKIACINCLEDDIPLLWEELPEEKKDYFYNKVKCQMPLSDDSPFLPFCWPHILKGELSRLDYLVESYSVTFNQWAFEGSALMGNKMATEYFFPKVQIEGKSAHLKIIADFVLGNGFYDVLFYLLPFMNCKKRNKIFNKTPFRVLFFFLDWPWQDLFLKNSFVLWNYFRPDSYNSLLHEIHSRFKNSDPYIQKLFPEFFKQSPVGFKERFINSCYDGRIRFVNSLYELEKVYAFRFLEIFLESEDSDSIKAIFRNIYAEDRLRLTLNPTVLSLFHQFVLKDKLHMVELCLREAMLSEEHRKRVKEVFTELLLIDESKTIKFKRIFEFLDEADTEKRGEKRKLEDC
ncbi:unnamed protein product [Larinioides sclopetarius]|uniref:Uncharacterized protein n=1 Tax=Larinioides sclopetarius TaxID=280406 RepID=A0AAV2AZ91_9ARAC